LNLPGQAGRCGLMQASRPFSVAQFAADYFSDHDAARWTR